MTSSVPSSEELQGVVRAGIRDLSRLWWWFLLLGIVWTLFGMFVLTYRAGSVAAVAALVGIGFLFGGVAQLAVATRIPAWRWLFIVIGLLSVAAAIVTFIWPDMTLYALSVFLAWFLIVFGIMHVVTSLAGPKVPWWWTLLLLGVAELVLGVWSVRSWERSLLTLLTLVGIWAIFHGLTEIFAAFSVREAGKWAERALR